MAGGFSRYRDVVAVTVCLLVPAVVLYAQSRSDAEAGPVLRVVLGLTAPLQNLVSGAVTGASDWWEEHRQDARSIQDARSVRREIAGLRRQAERNAELERENARLRALLFAAPPPGAGHFVAARVISVGASPAYRVVRLDVGRDDGVQRGMAVLAAEGTVGSVLRTSGGYADVMLISDRQSAVDVMVARTGTRGLLRGGGGEGGVLLKVEGLDKQAEIRPGDEMVTTGLGARFPRGTRVGWVVSTTLPERALNQTADVRPAVPFDRLRDVLVVLRPETASAPWQPRADIPEPGTAAEPLGPVYDPGPAIPAPAAATPTATDARTDAGTAAVAATRADAGSGDEETGPPEPDTPAPLQAPPAAVVEPPVPVAADGGARPDGGAP